MSEKTIREVYDELNGMQKKYLDVLAEYALRLRKSKLTSDQEQVILFMVSKSLMED